MAPSGRRPGAGRLPSRPAPDRTPDPWDPESDQSLQSTSMKTFWYVPSPSVRPPLVRVTMFSWPSNLKLKGNGAVQPNWVPLKAFPHGAGAVAFVSTGFPPARFHSQVVISSNRPPGKVPEGRGRLFLAQAPRGLTLAAPVR